ncbi:MAG: ATP-binding protein [Anaerolineae bacterium]|jgi:signal transduction histidine kinase|nr:ATP-binding protein [Anaerolineae bacterium]
MTALPSREDFALEVKTDRLKILYRSTLVVCGIAVMLLLTFGITSGGRQAQSGNVSIALGLGTIMFGCLVTHLLLVRGHTRPAAWAYGLGAAAGIGLMMTLGDATARELLPFAFPMVVFIIGLLLSPLSTVGMACTCAVIVLAAPSLLTPANLTVHQVFAVFLMLLSALLAAQVTGELYQIAEWALSNYQRERRTNEELFEKRQALQLSLKRSEALADKLLETNRDLEQAKAQAEEAKTFRGKFLANMSHELRTPLNAIIGFSETMLEFPIMYDNVTLPNAYEKDLGQIYNSGRQLLHVINDILDLAKVDAGKLEIHPQKVDVTPVIAAVISTARGLLGQRPVRLEQELPETIPPAWADETRLRQVLLNLYSNACKYTDSGFIRLRLRVLEDELEFSVQDTGTGIDEEYHTRLFQEFQQAKASGRDPRSGSGLGLAISHQLLQLMQGRIWLTSTVGEGSTFFFTIKRYHGQDKNGSETQPDRRLLAETPLAAPSSTAAGQGG